MSSDFWKMKQAMICDDHLLCVVNRTIIEQCNSPRSLLSYWNKKILNFISNSQVAVELRPNMNTRFMGSKAKIWFFVNILKIGHEAEKAANDKIIKAVTDFIMAQKFPGLEDDG